MNLRKSNPTRAGVGFSKIRHPSVFAIYDSRKVLPKSATDLVTPRARAAYDDFGTTYTEVRNAHGCRRRRGDG